MKSLLGATLLAIAVATPAFPAGMLYKSVDSNGRLIFSDTPPVGIDATIVEQRALPGAAYAARQTNYTPPAPRLADGDEDLVRANEQVDLAERALAQARRNLWSAHDGLKMQQVRVRPEELERVEGYKKSLRSARVYLAELLRDRQGQFLAAAAAPAPGMPIIVAVNYLPRR